MEERIIDNEREIKIKRKRGGDDVVDALAEDGEVAEGECEEELVLELPEGEEYDEDLVGLTPAQLKEELARREKAKKEASAAQNKLMLAGGERLAAKEYAEAESLFSQALVYGENAEASKQLWRARTAEFTEMKAFYKAANAEELAESSEAVRSFVLERAGQTLKAEREEYRKEEAPLREKVEAAMEERRVPFLANKNYYSIRFRIFLGAFALCLLWAVVSASTIYSTEGMLPVWLAVAAGALALACLGFAVFFARKLYLAKRLCEENERLSSTEEGARLEELQTRLKCLEIIFGEDE